MRRIVDVIVRCWLLVVGCWSVVGAMLPPTPVYLIGHPAAAGTRAAMLLLYQCSVPFVCLRVRRWEWAGVRACVGAAPLTHCRQVEEAAHELPHYAEEIATLPATALPALLHKGIFVFGPYAVQRYIGGSEEGGRWYRDSLPPASSASTTTTSTTSTTSTTATSSATSTPVTTALTSTPTLAPPSTLPAPASSGRSESTTAAALATARVPIDAYLDWHHHLALTTASVLELTTEYNSFDTSAPTSMRPKSADYARVGEAMKAYLDALRHFETSFLSDGPAFIAGGPLARERSRAHMCVCAA